MIKRTPKLLIKIIALVAFTFSVAYACGISESSKGETMPSYKDMSTVQLQAEVERLSSEDKLPFEMGLELIERWSTTTENI